MARILKVIIATLMVIVCGDSFGQAVPPETAPLSVGQETTLAAAAQPQ